MFSTYPMLHISIKWCASLCSHHFVCYAFMPIMLSLSIMSFLFHASSPKRKNVNVFIKCHVFRKGRFNTVTQLREGKGREGKGSCSVVSDSLQPHGPTTLLRPWNFPGRVLEWVAISFSRGSSWSRDQTWISCTVGRRSTVWATREVLMS